MIPVDTHEPGLQRPASVTEVLLTFNRLAMQGFGGVLAIAQYELVERKAWLTRERYLAMLSICQVLPGPNIINMGLMIGDGFFGWRGALAAITGLLALPLAIVLTLAAAYAHWSSNPVVAGALRGMGAVAAGLIIATAIKLGSSLRDSPLGVPACIVLASLIFASIAWMHWPLVWVLAALGPPAVLIAWRRLR